MAFNIYSKAVVNPGDWYERKIPWRCDKCHKAKKVMLQMSIDYDKLILCKECLNELKRLITITERELKDVNLSEYDK